MEEYLGQVSKYFENVPLWPFFLLAFVGLVSLAIEATNRKRREDAIRNFREMFETDLAELYPNHTRWPNNVNGYLCSRLPDMQQNFEVLRVFIPQKKLLEFNTAWNRYCDFCRNITDEKCAMGQSASANPDGGQSSAQGGGEALKKEFHQLITDLLEFAKTK